MVPIKYASEKTERSGDPVANNVYFFNKVNHKEQDNWQILYNTGNLYFYTCIELGIFKEVHALLLLLYIIGSALVVIKNGNLSAIFTTTINDTLVKIEQCPHRGDRAKTKIIVEVIKLTLTTIRLQQVHTEGSTTVFLFITYSLICYGSE